MLTGILSRDTCASCRICCAFDDSDLWETPVITRDTKAVIQERVPHQTFVPLGNAEEPGACLLHMDQEEDGLYHCPMLTETGCALGEQKPFDCRIWPFRVMKTGGQLVITLSDVCPSLKEKSVREVSEFLQQKLADQIFQEARQHPAIVKDYVPGLPIFAVEDTASQ